MAESDLLTKTPAGDVDEPAMAQDADTKAAAKLARGNLGGHDPITVPTIKGDDDYAALNPGMKFKDSAGKQYVKPYKVESDEQYEDVPEGADIIDAQGKKFKKPAYEGIDFTAQTLYDMAVNDKERRKALERSYPGKVKDRAGKLYIDDDGTLRRPKGFGDAPVAGLAAAAAPTLGSIGGEIAGAGVGTAVAPGPGTVGGAVAGGAIGGAAGQGFNDIIMGLAGVYDRSVGEEALNVGEATAAGGIGTAGGRAIAAVAPAIKGAVMQGAPKAAAKITGATAESLETAIGMKEKDPNLLIPPSQIYPELPHVANIAESFFPAFYLQNPMKQAAVKYIDKSYSDIFEKMGLNIEGSVTKPTEAPSAEKAGQAILQHRLAAQQISDSRLEAAKVAHLAALQDGSSTQKQTAAKLTEAAIASRKDAEGIIKLGFDDIRQQANEGMKVAGAGHNSGELWWNVGKSLQKLRQGIAARGKIMYDAANTAAGAHEVDIGDLPQTAAKLLEQLPQGFEGNFPAITRSIRDLAGVPKPDTAPIKSRIAQIQIELAQSRIKPDSDTAALQQELGGLRQQLQDSAQSPWLKEPQQPTFGQLHNLRSEARQNYYRLNLTPDIRDGQYKMLANQIDAILKAPGEAPELKEASRLLGVADDFWRENMGKLNDSRIQAVLDGLDAGLPADPQVLYDTIIKEGYSERTKYLKDKLGPALWSGIKAADLTDMLNSSRSIAGPDQIDGSVFAREVEKRYRGDMLELVHGPQMANKLLKQAQYVRAIAGKMDVPVTPGDTALDTIMRARAAATVAKQAGEKDPLTTLGKEMSKVESDHAKEMSKLRGQDPLGFLYNPTVGAAAALDKITGSPDLVIAAAGRFGTDSESWRLIKEYWVQKLFMGHTQPGVVLKTLSPEVQNLLFPGVERADMMTLAKESDMLFASKAFRDTAKSMMAQSAVEHPWSRVVGKGGEFLPKVPLGDAAARSAIGAYFKMVTKLSSNLPLMKFVLKGLKGDPQGREMARQAVQNWMQKGGAVGAGVGQAEFQAPSQ